MHDECAPENSYSLDLGYRVRAASAHARDAASPRTDRELGLRMFHKPMNASRPITAAGTRHRARFASGRRRESGRDRTDSYGLNTYPGLIAALAGIGGKSENNSGLFFITFRMYFGSMFLLTSNVDFRNPSRCRRSSALHSAA